MQNYGGSQQFFSLRCCHFVCIHWFAQFLYVTRWNLRSRLKSHIVAISEKICQVCPQRSMAKIAWCVNWLSTRFLSGSYDKEFYICSKYNRSAYDSLKFLRLIAWFLILLLQFGFVFLSLFPQLALKLFDKPTLRFVSRYSRLSCP